MTVFFSQARPVGRSAGFSAVRELFLGMLCLLLLVAPGAISAQTTGAIVGTVTDERGARIVGADVTARDTATGVTRSSKSNGGGEYSFPALAPGDYEITFAAPGFANQLQRATLNVTDRIAVNAKLSVTSATVSIEVRAQEPLLQTENTAQGRVIDGESVRDLPLATNNFTQLLALAPGASAPLNDATALGRGTQNISSNGARTGSNAIYIDGVDAINVHVNSAANNTFASNGTVIPPTEAIQEFKIQTALFDALTGRSGGSNVAVITRSGTSKLHGSLYEFFRNDDLNANLFFFNYVNAPRPKLKQNQFGATVGGQILPGKVFGFFSYQGTRQINGVQGTNYLSLPQVTDDRSAAALGAYGATLGKTSHSGPTILANGSNISPTALALLQYKLPNGRYLIPTPLTSATVGVNYAVSVPSSFDEDEYTGSTDYQIRSSDRLSFHTVIAEQPQFNSLPNGTTAVAGFGTTQLFKSRLFSIAETHILSSSMVNEFRVGLSRLLGTTAFENQIPLASVGMTRFNSNTFTDIPQISISGEFRLGYSVNADQADASNTWQYFDNLSVLKGHHNLNFGVEMRRYQDNYFSNNRMRGTIDILSFQNFLLGQNGVQNGTGYSDLYTTSVASGVVQRDDRIRDVSGFAQDSWKARPNLTVNFGLRYEYLGLPVDRYGRNGAFDPRFYQAPPAGGSTSLGFVQESNARNPVPGIAKVSNTLTDNVGHLNFAPRLGLSMQVLPRVVVRAGYGLFYDRLSNQLGLLESLSLPNYVRTDGINSTGGSGTQINQSASLANPFPTLPQASQFPVLPVLYSSSAATTVAPISINDIDPKLRTPYYQQYGANLQTQITRNSMLEVGYVGARGIALPVETEINQAQIASAANPVNGQTATTTSNVAARSPYQGFSNTGLLFLQTTTYSNYNSLQGTLIVKSGHSEMLATYAWSHSLDDASGSADGSNFNSIAGDQTNPRAAYGSSDFDRTHHLAVRFVYDAPRLHRGLFARRYVSGLVNGYNVSGVVVAQSGLPYSITNTGGATYYGTDTSLASYAAGRTAASAVYGGRPESRLLKYFDTSAFVGAGTVYGNTGRNIMRGPFQRNVDLAINKRTTIHDSLVSEFRLQAFNVFNMVNFANPGNDEGTAATYGIISSTTGNPRILQLSLKLEF
ncbi:TonB-dependent Receptor Plug Domain [Granulicella rosea]|uniref:TonB-dependent Receptor Plug Domain n=1 Tax=Granulicella rosea TaxID=474952 RepID=A0A239MPQ0_9BACT|nr:carboxypeptidase regulatory-like domain-containing protein [Granulicella rosea]SNT44223.1 TonB-dependent Receptor Plug Domain [Granulicella rosea]